MTMPKPWLVWGIGLMYGAALLFFGLVPGLIGAAGSVVVGVGSAWRLGWRPSDLRRPARPEPVCACEDVDELDPDCAVHGAEL